MIKILFNKIKKYQISLDKEVYRLRYVFNNSKTIKIYREFIKSIIPTQ